MNLRIVASILLATAAASTGLSEEAVKTGVVRQTLQAVVMQVGSDTTIYPIHARVNYTTVIILPQGDKIIDWLIGDKGSWVLEGAENLAYVRPAEAGHRTNINLITTKGNVYSFDIDEVSATPSVPVDEKVILRLSPSLDLTSSSLGGQRQTPRFVSYDDFEHAKAVAVQTAHIAQETIERDHQNTATAMHFAYKFKADKKPFFVRSIYDDGKFTYIQMSPRAQEKPALYLLKDGKPELTNYTFLNDVYTIDSVVDRGYLRLGKAKLAITRDSH
jgi:type IV secretion system protein VirB9